jgi:HEPN domain-containing protein
MNRTDFQKITTLRVQESRALMAAGYYHGAYYLIGYAVECALKACVAKKVRRCDFPDKKFTNKIYTHNLEELMKAAEVALEFSREMGTNPALELNWTIVKDWSEDARYDTDITEAQARDLYTACTGRNGVLPWVKRRW